MLLNNDAIFLILDRNLFKNIKNTAKTNYFKQEHFLQVIDGIQEPNLDQKGKGNLNSGKDEDHLKQMFPINHPFCFPMVFYTHPQFLFPNAQILPMNPNLYSTDKFQSESSSNILSCQQIERESSKHLQNDGKWVSIKKEDKQKELMKKKIIGKKTFKQVDSAEQAQRLKKKLANRPKTYQTEKKMYMNTDLTTLGCSETNRRILRKRPSAMKRIKILKEKSSSQERQSFQEIHQLNLPLQDTESKKLDCKILNIPQKILGFYDPHATLPKAEQTFQDKKQIELKKMNLLSRKVDFVSQSTF